MIRSNFHTHTVFCDGKSTAREMVEQAIKLGFTALGFSGHVGGHECLTPYSMSDESHVAYLAEINGRTESPRYLEAARATVAELCKFNIPFEINTGAMARGYKTSPYPDCKILKMIKDCGGSIMINSDCHNKDLLDFGFNNAQNLAQKLGFTQHAVILDNGIGYLNFE